MTLYRQVDEPFELNEFVNIATLPGAKLPDIDLDNPMPTELQELFVVGHGDQEVRCER